MKTRVKIFLVLTAMLAQACSGGGGSTPNASSATPPPADPPVVAATNTPSLHFALPQDDPNSIMLETDDGTAKTANIVVTFYNISSNGKETVAPSTLPMTQPSYPLAVQFRKQYKQMVVRYPNSDRIVAQTAYIPDITVLGSRPVPYATSSLGAATPNVIPVAGTQMLVMVAPASGDYAPLVAVRHEKPTGNQIVYTTTRPSLPMPVTLEPDDVRIGVSTGTLSQTSTYVSGLETVWERVGISQIAASGTTKSPLDGTAVKLGQSSLK